MEIVNLDAIVPDNIKVKAGGLELTIPGNSSVEYAFRSIKYAQELQKNPMDYDSMEMAFDNLWDEISPLNPTVDKIKFRRALTVQQYTQIISMLYGGKIDTEAFKELEKKTDHNDESSDVQSQLEK